MTSDRKIMMRLGVIGFLLGMLIGNGMTVLFSSGEELILVSPELSEEFGYVTAVILQTVISGLVGAIIFSGTMVFYSEGFGITSATFIHMGITLVTMLPMANFLWWTGRTLEGTMVFLGMILIMYLLVWTSVYTSYRIQIQRINESLEKRRSGKN